ncbi:MAG: hypothetical protein ACJ8FS_01495 [Sphingomicrobium sp.]
MRFDGERTYKRVSEHQFVDAKEPDSAARRLQRSSLTLDFTLAEWRTVATTAGVGEGAEELSKFSWVEDEPPQVELRLELSAAKRRFYAVKDGEAATPIAAPISFRIAASKGDNAVGYIQHVPSWEHGEVKYDHSIEGRLFVPPERMAWLIGELGRPNARLHVSLTAPLYKEEIARAFDEPWYSQDIAVPYEEVVSLQGYQLHVVAGPVPLNHEQPEPEEEEDAFEAPVSIPDDELPMPPAPQSFTIADRRLNWILYLLAALVVIELVRR